MFKLGWLCWLAVPFWNFFPPRRGLGTKGCVGPVKWSFSLALTAYLIWILLKWSYFHLCNMIKYFSREKSSSLSFLSSFKTIFNPDDILRIYSFLNTEEWIGTVTFQKSEGYSNRRAVDLLNSFHSWNKLNFQLGWIWCFAWRPSQDILFQYKVNSGNINPTINVYIFRRRGETFVNICHFIRKEMLFTWFNSQHS